MTVFLQSLVAFLLVLGPLVFIHELGHFLVAKAFKIGVPVFSLGFGPRLFGFRRGETDYRVSIVPLGGYVRLAGDEADENRRGLPEEFLTRPKWQRFLVFVAGATFNVALAVVISWGIFVLYGINELPDSDSYPRVQALIEGSPAEAAGMQTGDLIVAIGGHDVRGLEAFNDASRLEIALSPNQEKEVIVEREGRRIPLSLTVAADPKYGHGLDPGWGLGWGADPPVLNLVLPDTPAERAGLRSGDVVRGVDGIEPISRSMFQAIIVQSEGRSLQFKLERAGEIVNASVTPVIEAAGDGTPKIGVQFGQHTITRDLDVFEAASAALSETVSNSTMLFQVLKRMLTREVPLKSVSGPIGIAQVARTAIIQDGRTFFWLLGFFSLQLGILNLLPIPVLDGGHILILAIEGAIRRDLPDRLKERVMQVGFVFLLAFMSAVIYMDFLKL